MNVSAKAMRQPMPAMRVMYATGFFATSVTPSAPFLSAVSTTPVPMPVATPENRPYTAKYMAELVTPVFSSSSAAS